MKENKIIKYECEFCHTMYDYEESAIYCEEKHKKLETIPIKCITYNQESYPCFRIYSYPNAKYNKEEDRIQLHPHTNSTFVRAYYFEFDKIQYDKEINLIKIYTKNFDENYEKECIHKIVDYKTNELNNKINRLNELNIQKDVDHREFP